MDAIERDAPICPPMDELYSLLGQNDAQQAHQQIAELIEALPGRSLE